MDKARQTAPGERTAQPCGNDHVGPGALVPIRHLFRQNRVERGRRHPGSRQNPYTLQKCGRAHHRHQVAAQMRAALQQQRHVQHDQRRAPPPMQLEEAHGPGGHQRMQDPLQPFQRRRIPEHPLSQGATVHRPVPGHTWKGGLDRGHCFTDLCHQRMDGRIGVMNRKPHPPQHRSGGGFSHTYGTGQPEDDHRISSPWVRMNSSSGSSGRPSTEK